MPPDVTLTLSRQEFEYLIQALGQRPFLEVQALIGKLVAQANGQLPVAS